jgi:hypothetical protein
MVHLSGHIPALNIPVTKVSDKVMVRPTEAGKRGNRPATSD